MMNDLFQCLSAHCLDFMAHLPENSPYTLFSAFLGAQTLTSSGPWRTPALQLLDVCLLLIRSPQSFEDRRVQSKAWRTRGPPGPGAHQQVNMFIDVGLDGTMT